MDTVTFHSSFFDVIEKNAIATMEFPTIQKKPYLRWLARRWGNSSGKCCYFFLLRKLLSRREFLNTRIFEKLFQNAQDQSNSSKLQSTRQLAADLLEVHEKWAENLEKQRILHAFLQMIELVSGLSCFLTSTGFIRGTAKAIKRYQTNLKLANSFAEA
jgi:hypothetical protein